VTRPDDGTLTEEQFLNVQHHADRLLRAAAAYDRFPTPVADILSAAELTVIDDELLDANLIRKFMRKARSGAVAGLATIKSALSKILGLFEPHDRLVILDKNIPDPRLPFVKLHEAGHGFLPHQSGIYALIQDCERSLDPYTTDLFEREANVFASEVLFQGQTFAREAHDQTFGIKVPMGLAKKIGASNYATFRRYVDTSPHTCCVVVLEQPTRGPGGVCIADIRRVIVSKSFNAQYDGAKLFPVITQDHPIAPAVPRNGRRMAGPRDVVLLDRNGDRRVCTAEAFDTKHQILVLLRDVGPLRTGLLIPRASKSLITLRKPVVL
jgi:Zn-dependent peptidase ImmA (M78 family)